MLQVATGGQAQVKPNDGPNGQMAAGASIPEVELVGITQQVPGVTLAAPLHLRRR